MSSTAGTARFYFAVTEMLIEEGQNTEVNQISNLNLYTNYIKVLNKGTKNLGRKAMTSSFHFEISSKNDCAFGGLLQLFQEVVH